MRRIIAGGLAAAGGTQQAAADNWLHQHGLPALTAAERRQLLKGQAQADRFLTADQVSARAAIGQRLTAMGNSLTAGVLARSFAQLTFSGNPLPGALLTEAQHAAAAGLIKPVTNFASVYDLGPLNQILKSAGQQPVGA